MSRPSRTGKLRSVPASGGDSQPLRRPRTRSIVLLSGKGGVGKTALATNLAIALTQAGRRTLLIDGDWGMGNVDLFLGLRPRQTIYDIILGSRQARDLLVETHAGLMVLPGASGVEEMADLDDLRCERLLCSLAPLEDAFDLMVFDTASGIGRTTIHLAQAADDLILVTTPDPPAVADAYATLKVLVRRGVRGRVWIVVNHAAGRAEAREIARRIRRTAKRFLSIEPGWLGYVVADPAFPVSVHKQEPLMRFDPDCSASRCIGRIAEEIVASTEPPPHEENRPEPKQLVVNMDDPPSFIGGAMHWDR